MYRFLAPLALGLAALPAAAAPGGAIATMQQGSYACELPGDVTGPAGQRVAAEDFAVVNASVYTAGGGRGSYLLTGDQLTMTSGPKRGQRFHKLSDGFLRRVEADGSDGLLRCVRRVVNNR